MTEQLVIRADIDGIATLTLNRPDKLNALTPQLFIALKQHIDNLAKDDTVSCVVLTGNGRAFCAGLDLQAIMAGEQMPTPEFAAEVIDALEELPQATIAKLNGHCLTGGLELALGCDFMIAAKSAVLGDTHGKWGLAPIWGMSVRLPERIGKARAKQLMFTSRRVSGEEAAQFGLVDMCVDDDDLNEAVYGLAKQIILNSRGTNRINKALMNAASDMTRKQALQFERTMPFGMPDDMQVRLAGQQKG